MLSFILRIFQRNLPPLTWILLAVLCARWFCDRRQLDYSMEHIPNGDNFVRYHYWPEAAERYRMAIELDPESHQAWSGLAVACCEMEHYAEALKAHDQAIRLWPYHARYRIQKADTLARSGQHRAALAELLPLKTRGYDRFDPAHQVVLAMAQAHRELDELQSALNLLDEALGRDPKDETLLKTRAEMYALLDDDRQGLTNSKQPMGPGLEHQALAHLADTHGRSE